VLKKTSAYTGLVIVTAAGALLTSSPAYALDSLVRGSYVHNHHRSHHRNRNWNGNRHHGRIFIRIYIYNKNNNHAVADARQGHRRRGLERDDALGVGAPGGLAATNRTPTNLDRGAVADRTPASTEQAPATTETAPAEQNTTAGAPDTTTGAPSTTTGAPSTTAGAPSSTAARPLDEGATGNVSP
jgi:hypothetical protein